MKALPVALLFLIPSLYASPTFSQVNCTTYLGGVTSCSGPSGYQSESRQHLNGQSSYFDNQGNSGTVTRTLNGGVNVSPTTGGRSAPLGGAAPRVSSDGRSWGFATGGTLTASPNMAVADSSELPVVDLSKLPKTPEEYRLTMLWMKAVEAGDFDKARELKKLIWQEQFSNATAAGKVRMFNELKSENRLAMMRSLDVVEKRIRWENRPAKLAAFNMFKEKALTSYERIEAEDDQVFKERLQEWKEEKEGNDRLAKFEADLAALGLLQLDPVEYKMREDELSAQWAKAEEEQKQRITAALDAKLDRLVAEEAELSKSKNKKVSVR